ncbi:MAG: DUF1080 domain-containing protein [Candidatus Hydrogenedentes bacterium]|nr:DUF1080 domain-containing protein [Candidatus Hydrogenedentota bacterium]
MKKMLMMAAVGLALLPFAATAKDDGVSLFDGKTLNGWIQKNGTATYVVKDGTVLGTTAEGSPNSFLCTEKEYGDFELTVEVKLNNNELNSGIQIRSTTAAPEGDAKFGRVNGPQVEIEAAGAEGAQAGYIYGEACGGWMTADAEAKRSKAFQDGDWNEYRIVAKGARIQTWINGEAVEDLTDEAKFQSHTKGFIALQVHGIGAGQGPYSVQWRNIKIKELK